MNSRARILDELEAELLAYDNKIKFCQKKLEELQKERYMVRVKFAEEILKYEKETRDERRESNEK